MRCSKDSIKSLKIRLLVILVSMMSVWFFYARLALGNQLENQPLTSKIGVYAGTLNDDATAADKKETLSQFQKAKSLGFSYVRIPFRIDPSMTTLTGNYNYAKLDYSINLAKKVGLKPIVYFVSGSHNPQVNTWNSAYPNLKYSPMLINIFKQVAVNTVQRYANRGIIWEGWNEPNGSYWFNQNGLTTVKDWVSFDQTVAQAVKKYNKNAIFLAGAFSGSTAKSNEYFIHARNNGLSKNASAISNHPYQTGIPENLLTDNKAYEGVNMPTVTTEVGYSTMASWQGKFSQATQAKYDARSIFLLDEMNQPLIVVFNLKDSSNTGWGLLTEKGQNKLSATYLSALLKNLQGYRYIKRIDIKNDQSQFALLYRKGSTDKVVYWSTDANTLVPVKYDSNNQFLLLAQDFPQVFQLNKTLGKHSFSSRKTNPQNVVKAVNGNGQVIRTTKTTNKSGTNVSLKSNIPNNYQLYDLFKYQNDYKAPSNNSVILYQLYAAPKQQDHVKTTIHGGKRLVLLIVGSVIILILIALLFFMKR